MPVPVGPPLFTSGCNLLVNPLAFAILFPGVGGGLVPVPIPGLPKGVQCETLPLQGLVLDTATNLFVLSNALDLTFGK